MMLQTEGGLPRSHRERKPRSQFFACRGCSLMSRGKDFRPFEAGICFANSEGLKEFPVDFKRRAVPNCCLGSTVMAPSKILVCNFSKPPGQQQQKIQWQNTPSAVPGSLLHPEMLWKRSPNSCKKAATKRIIFLCMQGLQHLGAFTAQFTFPNVKLGFGSKSGDCHANNLSFWACAGVCLKHQHRTGLSHNNFEKLLASKLHNTVSAGSGDKLKDI